MAPSNTQHSSTSIGHCTADLQGDPDFSTFAATSLAFYPNDAFKVWSVVASGPNTPVSQLLTFSIPMEGNVTHKQYPLSGTGNPHATAFWVKSVFGTWHSFKSIRGVVTVTVDENRQHLSATFHFTGESGSRTVEVTNGSLAVTGYSDGHAAHDTGSVTADIAGHVNLKYQSTQVSLSHEAAHPGFPASFFAWSQHYTDRPTATDYRLSLRIADTLTPGTYPISETSHQVQAFFYDLNGNFDSYQGKSGQLTLASIPPAGTTNGELKGTAHFIGVTSDQARTITVSNVHFSIKK